jgi:hypothetical protein
MRELEHMARHEAGTETAAWQLQRAATTIASLGDKSHK